MQQIAIFASGNGSNAERLMEYFKGNKSIKVSHIVCNNPNAGVIERAHRWKVPLIMITKRSYQDSALLIHTLQSENISFLVLAGFLWKIPVEIINEFPNKIINLHPALLPKFGGKGMFGQNVHEAVLEAKEQKSGITIHLVNENYDEGKILAQFECTIITDETIETLSEKIHELEHTHFPIVVENYIQNNS